MLTATIVHADSYVDLPPHATQPRDRVGLREVRLAIIGASGRVGRRVLEMIADQHGTWRATGLDLRVVAAANSRQTLVAAHGIEARDVCAALLAQEPQGESELVSALAGAHASIVLDCTASAEIVAHYPAWLAAGIDIVTPNKRGPSADKALARAIAAAQFASAGRLYDATTVGAQLPLLSTLRELTRAGDRVERFEAVLSGTLSYVLGRVQQGESLSTAVRGAVAEGYAEPHPARDLSGEDATRKLVILLRALGQEVELADIECLPLVDAQLLDEPDPAQLLQRLAGADETWRARAAVAQARREHWVYRASFEHDRARIAPERVPFDHPLANLAPCENKLVLHSAFYRAAPLIVSGPGAGIDLTAAGVLGDLHAALQRHRLPCGHGANRDAERLGVAA